MQYVLKNMLNCFRFASHSFNRDPVLSHALCSYIYAYGEKHDMVPFIRQCKSACCMRVSHSNSTIDKIEITAGWRRELVETRLQ